MLIFHKLYMNLTFIMKMIFFLHVFYFLKINLKIFIITIVFFIFL